MLAVADGLGSASRAADGSHRAVTRAVGSMQEALLRGHDVDPEAMVRGAFAAAREALERAATDGGLRELATTLLVLFARGDRMAIGHLGDGVILLRRRGELEAASIAPAEAYANLVASLTADDWVDRLRVTTVDGDGVDGVLMTTDGLEHIVLFNRLEGTPNQALVPKLLHLADRDDIEVPVKAKELAAWLASDMVRERTDDDVTLLLASLR